MSTSSLSPAELFACTDLLAFIDSAPTPFHAVHSAVQRLQAAGFGPLQATADWGQLGAGRYYVPIGDSALCAFILPKLGLSSGAIRGFRIVGAHTDSPNLRLKPRPVYDKVGYVQLGVEVYGGALVNSWLDRDLYIAGRVSLRGDDGQLRSQLVRLPQPLCRVAQLAIHLDREVADKGLNLNRQEHLAPIVGLVQAGRSSPSDDLLRQLCSSELGISADSIVGLDLMLADAVPGTRGGLYGELLFAPRLDNLAMCHAAVHGLLRVAEAANDPDLGAAGVVPIIALFDHEEIGSGSAYGAEAPVLPTLMERIMLGCGQSRADYLRAVAGSLCISADMAHAVHPNYADRHEPHYRPQLNGGPVVKSNAQQRYATCGRTAAQFAELCRIESVDVQHYVHRTDLPCGSTIGPITATQLGIPTVDVGNAMLSMHSIRELTGARDPERMSRVLARFLRSERSVA